MTSLIAAPPGTVLIDNDGHTVAVIVGFQYIQGNMVFPVFAMGRGGVKENEAIFHFNGYVEHPASQKFFESTDAWVAYAEDMADTTEAKPVEGSGPDLRPLNFGTKSNKTKSFFHWPAANAIFEIEGEQPLPDDPRVVKIKRDEMAELKRNGAAKIDPHVGVIEEDPAAAPADASTDEDEDMDVV